MHKIRDLKVVYTWEEYMKFVSFCLNIFSSLVYLPNTLIVSVFIIWPKLHYAHLQHFTCPSPTWWTSNLGTELEASFLLVILCSDRNCFTTGCEAKASVFLFRSESYGLWDYPPRWDLPTCTIKALLLKLPTFPNYVWGLLHCKPG